MNLEQYQIIELIQDRMELLAEMKGKTVKSITRITGITDETIYYHMIYTALNLISEKKLNKYSNQQYYRTYEMLGGILNELEELGY